MLQKEYIAQARQEQEEMKYEDNVQHHSKKKKHKPRPEQIENQLDEPQQLENIGNEQEDDLQPNFQPFKKEKKSFKDQIKCFIIFLIEKFILFF